VCILFTGVICTVQAGIMHVTAVAVSADGVPGHWDSLGCSNIGIRGSQALIGMIGRVWHVG